MTEQLTPDENQQEDRARQAKAFSDALERQAEGDLKLTLKGEAIEVFKGSREFIVTANGDKTFSLKDGPSHLNSDAMLKHFATV